MAERAWGWRQWAKFARMAIELRKHHPDELQTLLKRLTRGWPNTQPWEQEFRIECGVHMIGAMLDERASDASRLDKQQAAVREREAAVEKEQQALQQLIVRAAVMARAALEDVAADWTQAAAGEFPAHQPSLTRPPAVDEAENRFEVDRLLDKRTRRYGRGERVEYLIRWFGYGPEDASWEPVRNIDSDLIADFEASNHAAGPSAAPRSVRRSHRFRK